MFRGVTDRVINLQTTTNESCFFARSTRTKELQVGEKSLLTLAWPEIDRSLT